MLRVRVGPQQEIDDQQEYEPSEANIEQLQVAVVSGDLTQETTDAIVNPTDVSLSLGGLVSKKLQQAGGSAIAADCKKLQGTRDLSAFVRVRRFRLLKCRLLDCTVPRIVQIARILYFGRVSLLLL